MAVSINTQQGSAGGRTEFSFEAEKSHRFVLLLKESNAYLRPKKEILLVEALRLVFFRLRRAIRRVPCVIPRCARSRTPPPAPRPTS